MTAAVKLSRRAAETCRRALGQGTCDPEVGRAIAELERALQPKPKKYRPLRLDEVGPGDTLEFTDGEYAGQRVTVDRVSEMGLSAHVDGTLVGADGARVFFGGIVPLVRMALVKKARPKSSAVRKREARNRARAKETRSIYEQVSARANRHCERCRLLFTPLNSAELDHFFGRGKVPQSVENCWMLCRGCHREKTANYPDALWWLATFREHCLTHGYHTEARRVEARMDAIRMTRGEA